jgi:hypothetical protein
MKKNLIIIVILFGTLLFNSCEDLFNEILTAETNYFEMDFKVEAADKVGLQLFSEEVFTHELDKTLDKAGINKNHLQSVHLKEAEFSIISQGIYTNFNVLKFVELTVYNDSLGEEKIASMDPVPQDQSNMALDLSSENLLPYFEGNTILLTAQGYLLERIYEDVDLHARVKFELKGGV